MFDEFPVSNYGKLSAQFLVGRSTLIEMWVLCRFFYFLLEQSLKPVVICSVDFIFIVFQDIAASRFVTQGPNQKVLKLATMDYLLSTNFSIRAHTKLLISAKVMSFTTSSHWLPVNSSKNI